jgi:hypothetical protein
LEIFIFTGKCLKLGFSELIFVFRPEGSDFSKIGERSSQIRVSENEEERNGILPNMWDAIAI